MCKPLPDKEAISLARYLDLASVALRRIGHWSQGRLDLLSLGERAQVVEWCLRLMRKDPRNPSLSERIGNAQQCA